MYRPVHICRRAELPQYRSRDGAIPAIGTDTAARADALARVPAFLEEKLISRGLAHRDEPDDNCRA